MSYILEALEKSEQERKQHAAADLRPQPAVYPGVTWSRHRLKKRSRRLRPSVLLIPLLMAAAWLFREHIPMALEIKITRQSSVDPVAAPRQSPAAPATPATIPQPADSVDTASQETVSEDAASPDASPREAVAEPSMAPATISLAESGPQRAVTSTEQTVTHPGSQVNAKQSIRLQPAPLLLAEGGSPDSVVAAPQLPFLDEIPADLRRDLPKLKFVGHTFSAVPKDRLIIINNDIRREGDTVAAGLRLAEITWEGVILDFRGVRFQVTTTAH